MRNHKNIEAYRDVVGDEVIKDIERKIRNLSGKHIVCISSTHTGGGVAEILNAIIPLLNDMGLKFGWRIVHGTNDFFNVTKKFHNALQGECIDLSEKKKEIYENTNQRFSKFTHLDDHDLVVVHDPQPLALVDYYKNDAAWVFRCHIDISNPDKKTFNYLLRYINKYDHVVLSQKKYFKKSIEPTQSVIYPAIDPLSQKNCDMSKSTVSRYLEKYGVDTKTPFILQVSRFDKWKDPLGVIKIFEKVRETHDSKLILLGNLASDDPEGQDFYETVECAARKSKYSSDIKIILSAGETAVNAFQRSAAVVIQNSLKEGFGLTVSEALYKRTPVVATRVGGIPLQVQNGVNGYLYKPKDYEGMAKGVIKLLDNEDMRKKFGEQGHAHVKENFLITRLILDWLSLFEYYLGLNGYRPLLKSLKNQIITQIKELPKFKF